MQLPDYHRIELRNPLGGPVLRTAETGSTMADARSLVQGAGSRTAPLLPGTVLVAGYQSAGRGQGPGREWTAPAGSSLMFTLCLPGARISRPFEALPLRIALGMSWFLRDSGYSAIAVKWPNDVLLHDKKICGILCHHAADWFLVGVGLNVNQRSFPPDLRRPATSLLLEAGSQEVDVLSLLEPLLNQLSRGLATDAWREEVGSLLTGIGEEVHLAGEGPGYPAAGNVIGIDEGGALLVQLKESGEIEAIYSRDRLE